VQILTNGSAGSNSTQKPIMAKGILGMRIMWVQAQTHGVQRAPPPIRNPLGFEAQAWG